MSSTNRTHGDPEQDQRSDVILPPQPMRRGSLSERYVKCGKDNCTRCPHGPYWYAYWTENGRRRSRYVGKLDMTNHLNVIDDGVG